MQLPIYILAMKRLLGVEVIGAELRFLKDAGKEGIYRKDYKEALALNHGKGFYEKEEMEEMLQKAETVLLESVRRLREGDIAIRSKSCEFCRFDSVCRFEKWKMVYADES